MKINYRKYLIKFFIPIIILNNINFISNAGVLSPDTRYETFTGDNIKIDDVLENGSADIEVSGNSLVNLWDGFDFYQINWIQGKILYDITGKTITMCNLSDKDLLFELSALDDEYSRGIWISPNERAVIHVSSSEKFRMIQGRYDRGWTKSQEDLIKFNKSCVVVEGSYPTENLSYFSGMLSVGENIDNFEIVSKNENLDMGIEEVGSFYYFENGNRFLNPEVNSHLAIVAPNTTYNLSGMHSNITFWDSNFNFIKGYAGINNVTTPSNCKYIRYAVAVENEKLVKVEELNTSDYISQQTSRITIPLNEPLRGLPNGASDKIIKKNGSWYIERSIKKLILNGSENWYINTSFSLNDYATFNVKVIEDNKIGGRYNLLTDRFESAWGLDSNNQAYKNSIFLEEDKTSESLKGALNITINKSFLSDCSVEGFKQYLSLNPITVLYQVSIPTYEPLNIEMSIGLHEGVTSIFNTSRIPTKMEVMIDRVLNRAVNFTEIAKLNPSVDNISIARNWVNLLKDSIRKDSLQGILNPIINETEFERDKKNISANSDIYITPKNTLAISLNTNSIIFEDFNGTETIEKNKALNISVNSSLPYSLNAYLEGVIQNKDKTQTLSSSILNIKESTQTEYKAFNTLEDKVILKDNNSGGQESIHYIDLRLNSVETYKTDIYKASIKFEVEQK